MLFSRIFVKYYVLFKNMLRSLWSVMWAPFLYLTTIFVFGAQEPIVRDVAIIFVFGHHFCIWRDEVKDYKYKSVAWHIYMQIHLTKGALKGKDYETNMLWI